MAEPSDGEKAREMIVFEHLCGIAGLTYRQAAKLVRESGASTPIQPTDEDRAKVPPIPELQDLLELAVTSDDIPETLSRRVEPHISPEINRGSAQAYRLAQVHAMIRIALS